MRPTVRARPTPLTDVAVVDVTDHCLGAPLVRRLGAEGHPVVPADERAVAATGGLVVVAPVGLDEVVTGPRELWLRIERLARAESGRAVGPSWVVVLWAVQHHERATFATAHDGAVDLAGDRPRAGRNAALLLTGDGWGYELGRHGGDPAAAVECRSTQLRRLLAADSHQNVAGVMTARRLCADIEALAPVALHGVLVQLRTPDGRSTRWAGWAAAGAAVAQARRMRGYR